MTNRRAISWAVARALAVGLLLTLAAARVDTAALLITGKSEPRSTLFAFADGATLSRRAFLSSEHVVWEQSGGIVPPNETILKFAATANWSEEHPGYRAESWPLVAPKSALLFAQGWPRRAFVASLNSGDSLKWRDGVTLEFRGHPFVIALRPLWGGLIFDILFFACIASLLSDGPPIAKRWFLRRTGKCPSCGYSRAGLSAEQVCPECGLKA